MSASQLEQNWSRNPQACEPSNPFRWRIGSGFDLPFWHHAPAKVIRWSLDVASTTFCQQQMSQIAAKLHLTDVSSPGPAFKPLSRHDVAAILGVSVRTVENWRREQLIPPSVDIGGRVYWHPELFYAGLDAALRGNPVTAGAGVPAVKNVAKSNRAPASTGALEKSRKRSADAISAMINK
jgi:hypothetical protein